jgi:hypothetical protein
MRPRRELAVPGSWLENEAEAAARAQEAALDIAGSAKQPCPRCSGRMLSAAKEAGDLTCFSCGHVIYLGGVPEDAAVVRRPAARKRLKQ